MTIENWSSKRTLKAHVSRACVNCRKAHLACDNKRPCHRCQSIGKEQSCIDVDHKKRGRPKLRSNTSRNSSDHTPNEIAWKSSSFNMTASMASNYPQSSTTLKPTVITMFLSMEVCCARVSDEVQSILGYYPQELSHRSLYEFLASSDSTNTLGRMHRLLLDNVTAVAQKVDPRYQPKNVLPTERTTSDVFFSVSPATLCIVTNGSQTFTGTLEMKRTDGTTESLQVQLYLGGGLGADLYTPSTLSGLYIVCLLTRFTETSTNSTDSPQQTSFGFDLNTDISPPPLTTWPRQEDTHSIHGSVTPHTTTVHTPLCSEYRSYLDNPDRAASENTDEGIDGDTQKEEAPSELSQASQWVAKLPYFSPKLSSKPSPPSHSSSPRRIVLNTSTITLPISPASSFGQPRTISGFQHPLLSNAAIHVAPITTAPRTTKLHYEQGGLNFFKPFIEPVRLTLGHPSTASTPSTANTVETPIAANNTRTGQFILRGLESTSHSPIMLSHPSIFPTLHKSSFSNLPAQVNENRPSSTANSFMSVGALLS
ncbi:Zn(2)-C6 fungal-specific transcription factor [Phycomyces blakesleeanus]|uniref:Zn(2)-C6 fungal-specific transcription factor n=1 Tax=Phycomyces blakesleeanus TaxID=4837 RepID=A0ABR3AYN3_PHYBL